MVIRTRIHSEHIDVSVSRRRVTLNGRITNGVALT